MPKADPPTEVRYGSALIKLFPRADGRVAVAWYEAGKRCNGTRKSWDDANQWAKRKARELDAASGARWMTPAAAEQHAWLEKIAGHTDRIPELLAAIQHAMGLVGTADQLRAAAEWYAAYGPLKNAAITIREAIDQFLAAYQMDHRAASITGIKSELRNFANLHPEQLLIEVTPEQLRAQVRRGKPATRTVRNRISYWITFFNYAAGHGWWPETRRTPAALLTKPMLPKKSPVIFTPEQGARLLRAVAADAPQHLPYLLLAGWLGCRPSECQRVLWSDLDEAQSLLHLRAEVVGKVARERWVPVPPVILAILQQCRAVRRNKNGSRDHICRSKSQNVISEIAQSLGLSWTIDILRHSAITYRLQQVQKIDQVAEESGNSPSIIRDAYKRPIPPGQWEKWTALPQEVHALDWKGCKRKWTPEEEKLLGTATDREIAHRLGRSTHAVLTRRLKLGIASNS